MSPPGAEPGDLGVLLEHLPPAAGLDVVDLGCRDGSLSRRLVGRGAASVLALDLDVTALRRARERACRDGGTQDRIHYEQADLEQATLPFEAYDLAVCRGLLDQLGDPLRFARMVRAGLRQRGLLVCTATVSGSAYPVAAAEAVRGPVSALERAGFEAVRTHPGRRDGDPLGVVVATKPPRRTT